MDSLNDGLKKILQAGIGAVAMGVEKTQDALDTLAQKGEPLYEQAKTTVADAADKLKKAVEESGWAENFCRRTDVDDVIREMQEMSQEELDQVRQALEDIYPTRPAKREQTPNPENEKDPDPSEEAENRDGQPGEADPTQER